MRFQEYYKQKNKTLSEYYETFFQVYEPYCMLVCIVLAKDIEIRSKEKKLRLNRFREFRHISKICGRGE